MLQSSYFSPCVYFRLFCWTLITDMPFLKRNKKITCENCCTQGTKLNLAPHKKGCSASTMYCTQCHNFSTTFESYLNYNIAKKYSAPKPDVAFKCKLCYQEFPGFHAIRQQKNTENDFPIKTTNVEANDILTKLETRILNRCCFQVSISSKTLKLKERDRNR